MPSVLCPPGSWVEDLWLGTVQTLACIAGKGTGKTFVANDWFLREAMKMQPGTQGLVTFNTLQQCRDAFEEFTRPRLDEIGVPYDWNGSSYNLKLGNGSVIHWRSAEPNVVKRVETLQYTFWWGDECQEYSLKALKTFNSRVRKGMKRKRITAMPEDPTHYLYSFVERIGARLYELNVYDNPDVEFRESYIEILRMTYSGAELDRYLHGKRVSLTGTGIFGMGADHQAELEFDFNKDLTLQWDFNVEYCAVSAWQNIEMTDSGMVVGCPEAYQLDEPTVYENAVNLLYHLLGVEMDDPEEIEDEVDYLFRIRNKGEERHVICQWDEDEEWGLSEEDEVLGWGKIVNNWKGKIILDGDSSGDNRTAATSDSMWMQVKKVFKDAFGDRCDYLVEKANPSIKDTIQCANWALNSGLVKVDKKKASKLYLSVIACKYDKHGEIDKKDDYKEGTVKSHDADTFRYAMWRSFRFKYPGRKRVGISSISV